MIEMLVSLGIFTIMTAVVIYNYANFNSSIIVGNYAYDVALALRQAQVYGINVSGNVAGNNQFKAGYGIHFDLQTPSIFYLFSDLPLGTKGVYEGEVGGDPVVETFMLPGSYKISQIELINNNNVSEVSLAGSAKTVDITFLRPNPDATIISDNVDYNVASITIQSPAGITKKIEVRKTGQISVQ